MEEVLSDECQAEYDAWARVMEEMRRIGLDPDALLANRLVSAIQLWGEFLVVLRVGQSREQHIKAMAMYVKKWQDALGKDADTVK